MPFSAALVIGGSSLLSGMMGANAAGDAADASRYAADRAAEAAKFRPYSLTTGFGKSYFDTGTGTAGYEIDPRLAKFRDMLYTQAETAAAQLGSLDPQAEARKYVDQQMGLLAPQRQAEDIAARERSLQTGRVGLGVSSGVAGAGDAQGLLNPDDFARQMARERANAEIAAAGTTYGQSMLDKLIARSTGLFSAGAGVEELGLKPLTLGADIGKAGAVSGAYQGRSLLEGGLAGAQANLAGGLSTARAVQSAGQSFGGMFAPQPTGTTYYNAGNAGYMNPSYWSNPAIYDQMAAFGQT